MIEQPEIYIGERSKKEIKVKESIEEKEKILYTYDKQVEILRIFYGHVATEKTKDEVIGIINRRRNKGDKIGTRIPTKPWLELCDKLENKYETKIGENGIRLSGGEKQRLSIARAILKKSKIILLDEATSSLDAETEDKIQKAISFLTKDRTTIVIAHRLSTILNSNKIYVIDSGAVVAEGSHQELMNTSSIYKNFYNKQIKV